VVSGGVIIDSAGHRLVAITAAWYTIGSPVGVIKRSDRPEGTVPPRLELRDPRGVLSHPGFP